jgi:hypothetical protein
MSKGFVEYLQNPEWRRQHRWRRAIWRTMSRLGMTGMHGLPMKNLDPAFDGLKLVQISDLHYSPVVWRRYIIQYIEWVNEIAPDIVVVTGDLITGGYRYAHRIATILSHLNAPRGVICTFGNHDYSIYGKTAPAEGRRRADYLEKCLQQRGLTVLRNETLLIKDVNAAHPLAIVGLDDEWSGAIDAESAFYGLDPKLPIVCLNHNPANCLELMEFPWQWMLSGHTHGRQVATTKFGQKFYPHRFRHYVHGYYSVRDRHLYVNRGLSYGKRILDWNRPEITVFKLTREMS